MAVIPRYWYCEPVDGGASFEISPTLMARFGPEPTSGDTHTIFDPLTGEIHGEAILMSALPRARFRCFTFGKEVILPHRTAEALERHELEFCAPLFKRLFNQGRHEQPDRPLHYRVEITQPERFSLIPVYLGQWFDPFVVTLRGLLPPSLPLCPTGEVGGVPVKGLSGASLDRGGEAPSPASSPRLDYKDAQVTP